MELFPATEKLFDTNAYAVEFEAKVLFATLLDQPRGSSESAAHQKQIQDRPKSAGVQTWELILDRTLFFPEEGGQTPDTGEINGCPVTDVQLDGDIIRHFVRVPAKTSAHAGEQAGKGADVNRPGMAITERPLCGEQTGNGADGNRPLFEPGDTIHGKIDFAHRFSNMQNHSGEHILSGLAHSRFGCDNVGFHLSDNTVTLDFNLPLSDADVAWLEKAANRVVWDNKEIRGWYPDPQELETIEYRSKKEIDGPLRLVQIPGVDMCACCAPHVRRTGEIGIIKILRTLRERNGIRLTILCGSRALACLQAQQQAVEEVSHLTNMPREEIAAGVSRILEENEKLKQRAADLEAQVTKALAAAVPGEQEDVFLFADGIGNLAQRRLVNALCADHPGYCGVFVGTDEDGYRYIIGAGEDAADTRVLNACLHKACGARGGGKPAMVQGSVRAAEADILQALEKALHEVEQD